MTSRTVRKRVLENGSRVFLLPFLPDPEAAAAFKHQLRAGMDSSDNGNLCIPDVLPLLVLFSAMTQNFAMDLSAHNDIQKPEHFAPGQNLEGSRYGTAR